MPFFRSSRHHYYRRHRAESIQQINTVDYRVITPKSVPQLIAVIVREMENKSPEKVIFMTIYQSTSYHCHLRKISLFCRRYSLWIHLPLIAPGRPSIYPNAIRLEPRKSQGHVGMIQWYSVYRIAGNIRLFFICSLLLPQVLKWPIITFSNFSRI